MNLGLNNRVALVTGSSQGIGCAVARKLADEGSFVAITYRNEKQMAEKVAAEIRADGGDSMAHYLDLGSFASIDKLVETVLNRWGQIDTLINNAVEWGERRIKDAPPFEDLPIDEWQHLLRVNIEGPFRMIQAVVPSMRSRQWGRIVNVSSVLADDGLVGSGWYSTAKSSMHGLTRTLSKELGPSGILVNAVMPGLTATDRTMDMNADVRNRIEETSPLGRILLPEDVADIIVFLSSAANSTITGEILRVSGGRP